MKLIFRTRLATVSLIAFGACSSHALVTFPFVTVGNPGNPNDTQIVDGRAFGRVDYVYQISSTNVTNAQYTEFLNLVDPAGANTLGLYNPGMSSHATSGGILFDGAAPNGLKYAVKTGFDSRPVTFISFPDAMRFVNWLGNGQGAGGTETGAYTLALGGLAPRTAGAAFFIPGEDEWYKAAYYDPTKAAANQYYLYGTHSDTLPTAGPPSAIPNIANYANIVGGVTDAGAYSASASYYGSFDMAGNVWNWNDTVIDFTARGLRGGSWAETGTPNVGSVNRFSNAPLAEAPNYGFRVATVPEPSAMMFGISGVGAILLRRVRKGSPPRTVSAKRSHRSAGRK